MNKSPRHKERITDLMNQAATKAVPDTVDLWPSIDARLRPPARHNPTWGRRGALTVVAAVLTVLMLGAAFFAMHGGDSGGLHVASLQDLTPTVSPPPATVEPTESEPDMVCVENSLFCVPFGPNYSAVPMLVLVESQDNPRAGAMLYNPAGVVRGITSDGMPFIGNPAAPMHFEAVMDFTCSHCLNYWQDDLRRFIADYVLTGKAIVQLRLVGASSGGFSESATRAAYCAGEQGAFWEMVDEIFALRAAQRWDNSQPVPVEVFDPSVERLGLDADAFAMCMNSARYDGVLDQNTYMIQHRPVSGVPEMIFRTNVPSTWVSTQRTYDVIAEYTEHAQTGEPLAYGLDAVIAGEGAYPGGVYEASGDALRRTHVLDGDTSFFAALDAAEGWTLLTVQGDQTVPPITLQTLGRSNGGMIARYTTSEGTMLFNWLDGLPESLPYSSSALQVVDMGGIEDYTLTVQSLSAPVDLSDDGQDIILPYAEPVVIKFDVPDTELARLTIWVGWDGLSAEERFDSFLVAKPTVAVLAPYGETLTMFDPNRTRLVELTFMPPAAGAQFIVLNPMDTADKRERESIALHVSIASVAELTPDD